MPPLCKGSHFTVLQDFLQLLFKHPSVFDVKHSAVELLSPMVVSNQYLDGQSSLDCSQEIATQVDKAARALLEKCYAEDKQLLMENRALLDEISEYLLSKETITGEELMNFVHPPKTEEAPAETPAEEPAETEAEEKTEE